MLRGLSVREWTHHLESHSGEHRGLRPAFPAVQGLPLETPWRQANALVSVWADIPSQQYTEAAIVLVLGGDGLLLGCASLERQFVPLRRGRPVIDIRNQ
jgi:hypothetical protein